VDKPACKLIGTDGNAFSIIGNVARSLKATGLPDKAKEFKDKAMACESYNKLLQLAMEYVEVE